MPGDLRRQNRNNSVNPGRLINQLAIKKPANLQLDTWHNICNILTMTIKLGGVSSRTALMVVTTRELI